jgi:hypothetical protein
MVVRVRYNESKIINKMEVILIEFQGIGVKEFIM